MTSPLPSLSARFDTALREQPESLQDEDSTWARVAAAFAHTVLPVQNSNFAPPPEASNTWRSADVPLTPGSTRIAAPLAPTGEEAPKGELNTLTLKVDSEQFGAMSLTVRRGQDGTHILLSVDQVQAFQSLQLELQSLSNVLRAAGLNVASVRVSQRPGTGLAGATAGNQRRVPNLVGRTSTQHPTPERRRVKVIG